MINATLNRFVGFFQLYRFRKDWNKANRHNYTNVNCTFPRDLVSVGNGTYGTINIKYFSNPDERLKIGNFVSIADNVLFILGGNHRIDCLTNYPVYSKYVSNNPRYDSLTKGPVIVEDEVWIGTNVTVLSGIRIGKGAIIGAGAVVTKDIPPYAFAAGNPARIINYRFGDNLIYQLKDIRIQDIPKQFILDNIEKFYEPIAEDSPFLSEIKRIVESK